MPGRSFDASGSCQAITRRSTGRRVFQQDASWSELGRQVTVDFQSNADFHKCGSCPVHLFLPLFQSREHKYITARRAACDFLARPLAHLLTQRGLHVLICWSQLRILFLQMGTSWSKYLRTSAMFFLN
jgi:hypothetical protein